MLNQACCSPNSSKWLIRKVLIRTVAQPIQNTVQMMVCAAGLVTFHTIWSIGCQPMNMIINAMLAART